MEYSDPHTSTLLQLLKNISEEVEDLSPHATALGCKSPLASLNSKFKDLAASRSTSPNVERGPMGNLISMKAKSSSPPKFDKEVPPKRFASLGDFTDSANDFMEPEKDSNEKPEQLMPLIQITLTESQEKKKFTADTPSSSIMMEGTEVASLFCLNTKSNN